MIAEELALLWAAAQRRIVRQHLGAGLQRGRHPGGGPVLLAALHHLPVAAVADEGGATVQRQPTPVRLKLAPVGEDAVHLGVEGVAAERVDGHGEGPVHGEGLRLVE